jgi:hypothetical protein
MWVQIYFGLQAVIGIILIEWSFKKNARFLKQDEARDKNYPAFRRYDSKNWKRWKFYPGAMLFMPTRAFIVVIAMPLMWLVNVPITWGHDFKKGPLKDGFRKSVVELVYKFYLRIMVAAAGMWTKKVHRDSDYTYYLGPNYKKGYKDIKRTSTMVSNHISWLDVLILMIYDVPASVTKKVF